MTHFKEENSYFDENKLHAVLSTRVRVFHSLVLNRPPDPLTRPRIFYLALFFSSSIKQHHKISIFFIVIKIRYFLTLLENDEIQDFGYNKTIQASGLQDTLLCYIKS